MDVKEVRVGIADLNVVDNPGKLITVGLGSCIGIAIYDKIKNFGGLAHIMLPDSTQFTNVTNPYKFADMAIPILVKKMEENGASKRNMIAKIAGGASMFSFSDKSMVMDIGARNGVAVRNALLKVSIPIISEDIGGNKGRTIIFDTVNGIVQVKTVGLGVKEI
jgi:chemotaxis protein CheD